MRRFFAVVLPDKGDPYAFGLTEGNVIPFGSGEKLTVGIDGETLVYVRYERNGQKPIESDRAGSIRVFFGLQMRIGGPWRRPEKMGLHPAGIMLQQYMHQQMPAPEALDI